MLVLPIKWLILPLLAWSLSVEVCSAARILGVFPTHTSSHYAMYGTVMRALADRGHQVTVASHFPERHKSYNITDVSLLNILENPYLTVEELQAMSYVGNVIDLIEFNLYCCEKILKHPKILQLLESNKYDIFIAEIFGADCFLPIGYKLGIPTVGMISSVTTPWVGGMVANPDNPSYTPLYFLPFTQRMNFLERVANTVLTVYAKFLYETLSNWKAQELAENLLGPLPPLREISSNYSLILANSHFSVNQVRSTVPQLVEVGGLHIPKTIPPLPKDIEDFMNNSPNGVVLFSLGTFVPTESIPKEKLNGIIEVLGSLKQRVLWKINASGLPVLPSNIKTSTWVPQLSTLCHPSTKLFIGHGGLLGVQEAAYCGVPMLGTPMFADQNMNIAEIQERGAAILLRYGDITKATFSSAIDRLLNDESYRKNAKHLSLVFKERPQHPLDTAVYWIEYVAHFGGARHLRSAAHDLTWYQYYLLDVLLFLVATGLLLLFIVYRVSRLLMKTVRNVTTPSSSPIQTKKRN